MLTKPLRFKTFCWRVWYKLFTKRFDDITWHELLFVMEEAEN
jgi:hypothetical protein